MTTSQPIDPLNAIASIPLDDEQETDETKPAPWQRPTLSNPPDHDNPQGYLPKAHLVIVPDELPY